VAASAQARVPYEAACGAPKKKGNATCYALRRTDAKPFKGLAAAGTLPPGYGPADLQSAYSLSANGGAGETVAIVDAFDDPNAEADLAVYRQQYGLPACTTADGCFSKVSQRGGTDLPQPNAGWSTEISLDLDMVSAIAPNAHILLVEADDTSMDNLGSSVDEAVALGARFVSNSYGTHYSSTPGSGEDPSETTTLDAYYNHPGVAVVASSGDSGYGVGYPAASQYVTSVGGTALVRDSSTSRGWSETAWWGAGSGCSQYEPKPAFQQDTGCANRTVADVSAVADPSTPVAIYQTYGSGGWNISGGTSVAAPIIASVYADAGTPVAGTYPNSYPYRATGAGINDASGGSNGTCTPAYLCNGGTGYDGPTGLGSPNGLSAFQGAAQGVVSGTVTDNSTGKPIAGATITAGSGYTTRSATDGTYTLPVPVGTYDVTVNAFGYAIGRVSGASVTVGATLTENFALDPVPSQTVSGKVTDGSGHGWPLYAKITVDGTPSSMWTDPATGAYSLTLPQGHDYTLHVDASLPGYEALTKTVTVGTADQSLDLAMTADPWQATTPGYAVKLSGPTETFDSTTSAPQGWSVVNTAGTNGGWEFDDPGSRGNQTGGDGAFAIVDSDHIGAGASQDTQLVSPVYDLTGSSDPELAFNTMYKGFYNSTITVDATSDGGATWTTVWSGTSWFDSFDRVEVPLAGFAGKSAVQVRFHYTGSWAWYWEVDNVFVGQRNFPPTPGGLVVGQVKDANTGNYVNNATVTSQDDPAVTATTHATPDDPNLGDGFYTLFTPDLGNHTFTAARTHYTTLSSAVNVQADSTVSAPFTLQAGQLQVTPSAITASLGWGKSATKNVTVKNTGGAPATLNLSEEPGTFQMLAGGGGAPLQTVKGTFSPHFIKPGSTGTPTAAAGPSGSTWQAAPDLPQVSMDNVAGTNDGKVYSGFGYNGTGVSGDLYVLDPTAGSWTKLASAPDQRDAPTAGFINGKLYVVGGWNYDGSTNSGMDIYDPASNSWSTATAAPKGYAGTGSAVLNGKLYTIGGCTSGCGTTDAYVYDPNADTWTAIAPYPEPVSWESCAGIQNKIYCAGGNSDAAGAISHAYVYDPNAGSWSSLPDMPVGLWASAYSSANGQLVISSGATSTALTNQGFAFDPQADVWTALPNANNASFRGGAALGFYKVGGSAGGFNPTTTVELLPGYNQPDSCDVTWLSESTQQVTLQPGQSTTITVTLDSSVPEITQPGTFYAALTLNNDTPYSMPRIPVTMQVAPPSTWGKITGTVLGLNSDSTTPPLAGATVEIQSAGGNYSLTTAADGTYALWLDARNRPLTVIAAKDGYQPTVTTVKISRGTSTTVNFTLTLK
jgi:hypothetical protein